MTHKDPCDLDRDAFVAKIDHILRETAPEFDWVQAKSLGRRSGHVPNPDPWSGPAGMFPSWLTDRLQGVPAPDMSEPIALQELLPGHDARIAPPIAQQTQGHLIDGFSHKTISVGPVCVLHGGPTTHFFEEHQSLHWTESGLIPNLTPAHSVFVHRYLKDHEPKHLPGKSLLAVTPASGIFVHWMLDTLPQILQLIDSGEDLGQFDHFVFTEATKRTHRQTLDALGIAPQRVHSCKIDGKLLKTDAFSYLTMPRHLTATHPRNYDLLRDFFGARPAKRPTRRLYLSRANANRRKILNEAELVDRLRPLGFEAVCPEEYTLREQAAMMAEASHVISPHGAGMCNLVFAPPGCQVLELFGAYITPGYWVICNQMGHRYHALECMGGKGRYLSASDIQKIGGFMALNSHDITVPIDDTVAFIKEHLISP
ncbi:MAG: glycosyltransferase family 61 protein [Pseudomonadota bacterium]